MRDPEQVEDEVWTGCLAVAALTIIFMLGVIVALVFL
jgi:hypothetical protein